MDTKNWEIELVLEFSFDICLSFVSDWSYYIIFDWTDVLCWFISYKFLFAPGKNSDEK